MRKQCVPTVQRLKALDYASYVDWSFFDDTRHAAHTRHQIDTATQQNLSGDTNLLITMAMQ